MSDQPGTGVPRQPAYTDQDVASVATAICDGYDALPDDDHRGLPSVPVFAGTSRVPPPVPACEGCRIVARAALEALVAAGWARRDRIDLGNPLGWSPEQIRQHEEWNAELDAAVDREET